MITSCKLQDFIANVHPIIDVRSEAEYLQGHIPGAINLPILNNENRKAVGTCYKQNGRDAAVTLGFELAGPKFSEFIKEAQKIAPERKLNIYCWRGGMRSNIMAWVLSLAGFNTNVLEKGYKSYRKWTVQVFESPMHIKIIGGPTGSGKTEIIQALKKSGQPVIDLELLAHHKGSAFGALGQLPQSTQEQFENNFAWQLHQMHGCVWLENESRKIGRNVIPEAVFNAMRQANVFQINLPLECRIERILHEYGTFEIDVLAKQTTELSKRLGGLQLKNALHALQQNDLKLWLVILLGYYDKSYLHSNLQRNLQSITVIDAKQIDDVLPQLIPHFFSD